MSPTEAAVAAEPVHHNPIFEGSEKRVEIDFRLGAGAAAAGLRAVPRETIDELMALAHCCVVSNRSNEQLDAYVLSESSLFVYPTKWVLKTCGTTRLLASVPRLLEVAAALGLEPRRCKYTRASFLFPKNQPHPYTSFDNEVEFLEQYFGALGTGGNAYVLGEPCQGLQWHVYLADDMAPLPSSFKPTYNLEVCMTDLGETAAAQFFRNEHFISADRTTADSGISALKPGGTVIDDYVFEPCGYSMNGILDTGLITIHVTPEAHQSYASVEISGHVGDLVDPMTLLAQVVRIFRPGKISVTKSVDKAVRDKTGSWGVLPGLPAGYSLQGASSQFSPCGGKVCYFTLTEKAGGGLNSPKTPLHHAASFLSVGTTSSASVSECDADAGTASDPEMEAAAPLVVC